MRVAAVCVIVVCVIVVISEVFTTHPDPLLFCAAVLVGILAGLCYGDQLEVDLLKDEE